MERSHGFEAAGIGWKLQIIVFLLAAMLVISRRPDALFHPQFFAEDAVWYPQAYELGWFHALFISIHGYFDTLSRIAVALALLVPFRLAPLLLNAVGLIIQILPVTVLLSERCRKWGSLPVRALLAAAYVALPNSSEIDVNDVNLQWHLALLACLVVLAFPPQTVQWKAFDISVVLMCGLSGPFGLLLLPLAFAFWWLRRERWPLVVVGVLVACDVAQLYALFESHFATRSRVALGATGRLFLELLAGRVYLAALLGETISPNNIRLSLLLVSALLGTAIIVYCFVKGPLEWKLFLAFCAMVFAVSLVFPMASLTTRQWQVLSNSPGVRYWFFPTVVFIFALIWCATSASVAPVRIGSIAALMILLIGIRRDWRYPPYADLNFPRYAAQFASADPGALVKIPICPIGWTMSIRKKMPGCPVLPSGYIDEPIAGTRVSDAVLVAGWAIAPTPIRDVLLSIDHVPAQKVAPTVQRPDVDHIYPESRTKIKGWQLLLNTSRISPGAHELEIGVDEVNGCRAEIGAVSIERSR